MAYDISPIPDPNITTGSVFGGQVKPSKEYQEYLSNLAEWRGIRKAIIGKASQASTIKYIEKQIKDIDTLPTDLDQLRLERIELALSIYSEIEKLSQIYKELLSPIQAFIENNEISNESFQMSIDVSIIETGFTIKFFQWIAKNVSGSFYGSEGEKILEGIVNKYDYNKPDDVKSFLNELVDHLLHDERDDENHPMGIKNQLKTRQDPIALYDFIYSLGYLHPTYVLKLDNKEIPLLSPGERGALLLIFYLFIDVDDTPLIIDQPEENLDNQTVYQVLVDTIKEAKEKRQIIIVTHNPNLAVVCDAEQIIHCSMDKTSGNKITYISGSIENPIMNKYLVDVLEGTMPALNNRWKKYQPFRESLINKH